jgi:hypothetical protein
MIGRLHIEEHLVVGILLPIHLFLEFIANGAQFQAQVADRRLQRRIRRHDPIRPQLQIKLAPSMQLLAPSIPPHLMF